MKSLLSKFFGDATRKNTLSLGVMKMQALAALQIYLDRAFNTKATLMQVDIAVGKKEKDAAGFHCDIMVEACFFLEHITERREHNIAPMVTAKIRMRRDEDLDIIFWETKDIIGAFTHIGVPTDTESSMFKIGLFSEIDVMDRRFGSFRPLSENERGNE